MCTHYICGVNDCKNFAHIIYMAQEISKALPFFKYEVLNMKHEDFEEWYRHFFTVNNLKTLPRHGSPVVWREWLGEGRLKTVELIGGFSEFIEFCKECLHVNSVWSPKQVHALSDKILKATEAIPSSKGFHICILGAGHPSTRLLLLELLNNASVIFKDVLHIMLCDCACDSNENMKRIAEDVRYLQEECTVETVTSLDQALRHCQLLIVAKEVDRNSSEMMSTYFNFMVDTADSFAKHSRRSCRVLFTGTGYSCFNATVFLREYARVTRQQAAPNIAAVTSHMATECLQYLQLASSAPMDQLFEIPVWGFTEENGGLIVDYLLTKYSRMKQVLLVPQGELSVSSSSAEVGKDPPEEAESEELIAEDLESGTEADGVVMEGDIIEILLQGINSQLLRHDYKIVVGTLMDVEHKLRNVFEWVHSQKEHIIFLHGRGPMLSQVNATMDLLRQWYAVEIDDSSSITSYQHENFIFAGVPTDGTFGMKSGIVLSQPAVLRHGYLVPYAEYRGQMNYPNRKLMEAYRFTDSFGLYWNYDDHETDTMLKTLWEKFGDTLLRQDVKAAKQEKGVDHAVDLKTKIRACLREQKHLLNELKRITTRQEKKGAKWALEEEEEMCDEDSGSVEVENVLDHIETLDREGGEADEAGVKVEGVSLLETEMEEGNEVVQGGE